MERIGQLRTIGRTIGVLPLVAVFGCVTMASGGGGVLQDEILRIIGEPPLDQVNWGIRVVDPERGQILYNRHAHLKFVPASNMKLLPTATALSLLGPGFRFETDLYGVGEFQEEGAILHGDLLLRSGGDPTLSDRFYPSASAPLDSLAEGVWRSGVRRVTGSLVVDVSAWDSTSVPGTWEVDDLPTTSAATGGAFSIGEGVIGIEITAGPSDGTPAQARWWPESDSNFLSVAFVTVHADSSARGRTAEYLPESRRLRISGRIHAGAVDTIWISQRDPVRFASTALYRSLERRGIRIDGGLRIAWDPGEPVGSGSCRTGPGASTSTSEESPGRGEAQRIRAPRLASQRDDCPDARTLASLFSPPLAEVVQGILEPSQNWMAEQLVRALGFELGEEGSWREGFRVQEEFLTQQVGVDTLDIVFRDGSGMSRQNLVTPRAIVRILEYMRASSNAGIFRNALASPGEKDGTLRNRLQALEGRVFAKTGTLTHVTSLSGYLFTDSGRELIFSILTNGSGLPSNTVRDGIDKVTEILVRH
jgi:D-alanyl-D-alanine carboxypeptidase/D-alanyl-D-alanine-endopeptidase (penicillin-binding protein 4)